MYKRKTTDNYFIDIECNNSTYSDALKTFKEYIYNNPRVMYRITYKRRKNK